ncbi:MAG: hypothetical protein ACK51V_01825 [bacterium]
MKSLLNHRGLLLLNLLALLCGLGWAAVVLRDAWQPDGVASEPRVAATVQPIAMPEAAVGTLTARPLFNPRRRPPAVVASSAGAELVPPPVLVGVVGELGRPGVLLQNAAGGRSGLLRPQQSFAGWTVVSVRPRQVRLQSGDRVVVLTLRAGPGDQQEQSRP